MCFYFWLQIIRGRMFLSVNHKLRPMDVKPRRQTTGDADNDVIDNDVIDNDISLSDSELDDDDDDDEV